MHASRFPGGFCFRLFGFGAYFKRTPHSGTGKTWLHDYRAFRLGRWLIVPLVPR